jgi:hypothetical protein
MSDSKLENDCGLIIDPALLSDIQAQCRQRAAELEAAQNAATQAPQQPLAPPGSSQSTNGKSANLTGLTEAERFVAAVADMPAGVRRFFQHEEPAAFHQPESVENNAERRLRESFGGWCG